MIDNNNATISINVPKWTCGPPVAAEEVERGYKWLQSQPRMVNGATSVPVFQVLRTVFEALREQEASGG